MLKNNRKGLKLYKFLKYVLFAIILIIIAGSVFSLFKKKNTDKQEDELKKAEEYNEGMEVNAVAAGKNDDRIKAIK